MIEADRATQPATLSFPRSTPSRTEKKAASRSLVRFRGFSCPQEGTDEGLAAFIVSRHAQEYARRFIERFRVAIDRRSRGLLPLLDRSIADEPTFDEAWNVVHGDVRRAVLHAVDGEVAVRRAAALGLHLSAAGRPGDWDVELASPARLRWEHWLLPAADALAVSSDGRQAEVRLGSGRQKRALVFQRRPAGWVANGGTSLPTATRHGCAFTLLSSHALEGLEFGGSLHFSVVPRAEVVRSLRDAVSILAGHAPVYLPWVRRVVKAIIPVHARLSEIRSGSDFEKPGVVQASFPIRTVALAETLVHEASHQHFQIVLRAGPVVDGSDRKLYWSPVRQMDRPIDKILLAYHAFVNVLLLYRLCRRNGLRDGGYIARNEARLLPQLAQLEAPLRSTTGLTASGRALWEPLAERIH
jgi:HEXXH motif-containing protein